MSEEDNQGYISDTTETSVIFVQAIFSRESLEEIKKGKNKNFFINDPIQP